eukprot:284556_1
MTVSRFLRNPEQVSVALRGKIAAALDELGYIPNRAPDILSNATSRAIGVLLPSLTNQVFAEVLRGIESVTDAHGYQTMLAHYGYKPEMEQERLESMLSWNIDARYALQRILYAGDTAGAAHAAQQQLLAVIVIGGRCRKRLRNRC